MKRNVLLILCFGAAAAILGTVYTFKWDTEVQWLKDLHEVKSEALAKNESNRILLVGGSSVLFGLDPSQIEASTGRPTINLGLHAGVGGLVLLAYAEVSAAKGDTLILSIEQGPLQNMEWTSFARQFTAVIHQPRLLEGGLGKPRRMTVIDRVEYYLTLAQPGLNELVGKLSELVLGSEHAFPYAFLAVDDRGYATERVTSGNIEGLDDLPSSLGKGWLEALRTHARLMAERDITVMYALPWINVAEEAKERTFLQTARFLEDVNQVLPVLPTKNCGLHTSPDLFSDTALHLTLVATRARSEELGTALAEGTFLPPGSLDGRDCG